MSEPIPFVRGVVICGEGHRAKFGKGTLRLYPHYNDGYYQTGGRNGFWVVPPTYLHAEVEFFVRYRKFHQHLPINVTVWNDKGAMMVFPKIERHEDGYLMTVANRNGDHYYVAAKE